MGFAEAAFPLPLLPHFVASAVVGRVVCASGVCVAVVVGVADQLFFADFGVMR